MKCCECPFTLPCKANRPIRIRGRRPEWYNCPRCQRMYTRIGTPLPSVQTVLEIHFHCAEGPGALTGVGCTCQPYVSSSHHLAVIDLDVPSHHHHYRVLVIEGWTAFIEAREPTTITTISISADALEQLEAPSAPGLERNPRDTLKES